MKIAFWNINRKKNVDNIIGKFLINNSIDVLALAEYYGDSDLLLNEVNKCNARFRTYMTYGCNNIEIIGRYRCEPGPMDNHFCTHILEDKYIICTVHLSSNLHRNNDDRIKEIVDIKSQLSLLRKKTGIKDVLVLGDFNENPYENGVCGELGFNAWTDANDVVRQDRKQNHGESDVLFYNPMWNYYGDYIGPPGTYYHSSGGVSDHKWHIYDQAIISPSLIKYLNRDETGIITSFCGTCLKTKTGRPKKSISDHFPIIVSFSKEISKDEI